jgi:hypothetical protein
VVLGYLPDAAVASVTRHTPLVRSVMIRTLSGDKRQAPRAVHVRLPCERERGGRIKRVVAIDDDVRIDRMGFDTSVKASEKTPFDVAATAARYVFQGSNLRNVHDVFLPAATTHCLVLSSSASVTT